MQKKKPQKNSIVSILILMTLYHSNDANNKSKEVNIIDPEEQIICKLILNDRRIPSSHSARTGGSLRHKRELSVCQRAL